MRPPYGSYLAALWALNGGKRPVGYRGMRRGRMLHIPATPYLTHIPKDNTVEITVTRLEIMGVGE